jgi:hypothetical protein
MIAAKPPQPKVSVGEGFDAPKISKRGRWFWRQWLTNDDEPARRVRVRREQIGMRRFGSDSFFWNGTGLRSG